MRAQRLGGTPAEARSEARLSIGTGTLGTALSGSALACERDKVKEGRLVGVEEKFRMGVPNSRALQSSQL
jgi:hypothetical protein